jgi:aspartate/methionine/tyrosine aminotransferase
MFSSRLPAQLQPNRISRALDEARARGRVLLDLTETNPTRVGLSYPVREILDALARPGILTYEPSPRGLPEARAAVAGYYARHGVSVDPERVILTSSTSEAYAWLFKLLCDPGDDVLVPRPSYPLFDHLAALESVALTPYSLRYHEGWFLDISQVRQSIGPRTRAILVVNPNNPTGSFLTREESAALDALAAERGLAVISDEVFADYAFVPAGERVTTLAGSPAALTFSLSGLSKPVGLPQLKLGWILSSGPAEQLAAAATRLELIADTYLSVGAAVQHAAPRLLGLVDEMSGQILARVRRNREALQHGLAGSAAHVLAAEGGWSAILRVPSTRTDEEWTLAAIAGDGVIVHPGYFFELEGGAHVVASLLCEPATLDAALPLLRARFDAL